MYYNTFLIFLSLFISYNFATNNNYGQFSVEITRIDICKGPKSKNCVLTTTWLENRSKICYNMSVVEKMSPTNGKIVSVSKNNETMRYRMNKPCEHLFIRPVLHSILNVTKNCVILQGNYTFCLDFQEIYEKYYGGSFLYGSWTFMSSFYNNACNFLCQIMQVTISPKNKTSSH